jgi:hypothetical protein
MALRALEEFSIKILVFRSWSIATMDLIGRFERQNKMTPSNSLLVFFLFFMLCLYAGAANAATINAASCSQSAVQTAVNAASNGDTVVVPAGSCTWTSNLALGSKAITLQGAGVGNTNITDGYGADQASVITFTQHATISTRITGFSFLGMGYDHRAIKCTGSYTSAPMRIDHNSFYTATGDGTGGTVEVDIFSCRGLVDHNTFTAPGNAEMLHHHGDGTAGWTEDVTPGGTDALYMEDNTFTSISSSTANSAFENYDGSIVVARYNSLNSTQFDVHGCCSPIGGRWSEFYNNTWTNTIPSIDKNMDFRSGSGVIFNNSGATQGSGIVFRCDDTPGVVGVGYNYGSYSPVYVWNNGTIPVNVGLNNNYPVGNVCAANKNWYVSGSQPSNMTIWQTSSGATTYNYTPFTYPYPLDANGMPNPGGSPVVPPSPPTAVTVTVN